MEPGHRESVVVQSCDGVESWVRDLPLSVHLGSYLLAKKIRVVHSTLCTN